MLERAMILSVQDLVDALNHVDAGSEVFVNNRRPTRLSSWRGSYSDLAIEATPEVLNTATELIPGYSYSSSLELGGYVPGSPGVNIVRDPKVSDLLRALDLSLYAEFEGYKGGQYVMTPNSQIWVSEYGDASTNRIVGVEQLEGRVDLVTRDVGYW